MGFWRMERECWLDCGLAYGHLLGLASRDGDGDGDVIGLLRWPTAPEGLEMPLVRSSRDGLWLLAKSGSEYILRAIVEEDANSGSEESDAQKDAIRDAAGPEALSKYSLGDFESSEQVGK